MFSGAVEPHHPVMFAKHRQLVSQSGPHERATVAVRGCIARSKGQRNLRARRKLGLSIAEESARLQQLKCKEGARQAAGDVGNSRNLGDGDITLRPSSLSLQLAQVCTYRASLLQDLHTKERCSFVYIRCAVYCCRITLLGKLDCCLYSHKGSCCALCAVRRRLQHGVPLRSVNARTVSNVTLNQTGTYVGEQIGTKHHICIAQ